MHRRRGANLRRTGTRDGLRAFRAAIAAALPALLACLIGASATARADDPRPLPPPTSRRLPGTRPPGAPGAPAPLSPAPATPALASPAPASPALANPVVPVPGPAGPAGTSSLVEVPAIAAPPAGVEPPPPPAVPGPRAPGAARGSDEPAGPPGVPAAQPPPYVPAAPGAQARPDDPPWPEPVPDSPPPAADPDARVVRIEFQGNDLFSAASLKQLMGLKEGQPFDEAALDRDMALLARYFETARVVRTDVPGGVVLTFEVRENPLVVEVVIRGAAELKVEDIRKILRTKAGYPLFPHLLAADAAEVAAAYRLKGYAFAQVPDPVVTTPPEGGRRVEFTVVEGPKVEVDRIVFQGAASIRRKDLLEVMLTKEREFWDFMGGKVYREDALREDVVAITRLYQDEGFLDVEVALGDQRFSDDKERVEVTIVVQEHQPYRVGKVTVELEKPEEGREGSCTSEDCVFLTEARIAEWLGVQPGQRWNGKVAARGREKIREELYRRSYLSAVVREPELRGHERDLVADVTLHVVLGWKFRLRRIDFVGNEFTRDSFLRQEVCVNPGGYVDRNQLERGQARLRRMGYFAKVGLDIEDVPTPEGPHEGSWKDARYEIVEQKTGKLGFQVGLSTSGGLFGSVSFQKRNFDIARPPRSWHDLISGRAFTGNGQTFDAVLSPGTETTSFILGFTEPRFFGSDLSFSARLYDRIETRDEYLVNRVGYQVGLGYPVVRREDDTLLATVGVRWRHEGIDIYDLAANAVPGAFLFAGDNELRGLRAYVAVRAVDDLRNPQREFNANAGIELAGVVFGGDISQVKIDGDLSQLWALPENAEGQHRTITARARVGWARALEDTPEVAPFERWFLGGNDFRGFDRRGMGPHIGGNPTGGEWMLMGTLEFSQPLFGDTISAVLFTDIGTLGTSINEDDAWLWRWTVGPGLRIKVPALGPNPLAFDFGFVVLGQDVDERQLFSFSIARDF